MRLRNRIGISTFGLLVCSTTLAQSLPDSVWVVQAIEQARIQFEANKLPEAIRTLTPVVRPYHQHPLPPTLRPVDGLKRTTDSRITKLFPMNYRPHGKRL